MISFEGRSGSCYIDLAEIVAVVRLRASIPGFDPACDFLGSTIHLKGGSTIQVQCSPEDVLATIKEKGKSSLS